MMGIKITTRWVLFCLLLLLSACTTVQRTVRLYGNADLGVNTFEFKDGGRSVYYAWQTGHVAQPETLVFFYGGSGCVSWRSVMPEYTDGLNVQGKIFVLNKRFVDDRSLGLFGCGAEFDAYNNPAQWIEDYTDFITAQYQSLNPKPKHIVLVGVSEGAYPAIQMAARSPLITHLALIGSGGYSLRQSLLTLKQKSSTMFDIESGWQEIKTDPQSIEKRWYGNPYRWWSDVLDIDPLPDLLKLNIPILVAMGEMDESVPVESVLFLEEQFKANGKTNLSVYVYPQANHRLDAAGVAYRSDFFKTLSRLLQK